MNDDFYHWVIEIRKDGESHLYLDSYPRTICPKCNTVYYASQILEDYIRSLLKENETLKSENARLKLPWYKRRKNNE